MSTYTVTIHEEGKLLEICVPFHTHGSHVANIAAAHFPNEPEKNGLAPGAQIISMNIGDGRLDAMETGQALTRAFNRCAELGVHVANYSFGEKSHVPNSGRVIDELSKMVNKHGVVFLASASNSGPAMSTCGTPGATASAAIGVGAYLAPEMMDPMYSVREKIPGTTYTWSGRGPTSDGALGVSVCAEGAAVTGVPKYTLQGTQMMNGTSMSCPNATGTVACLLSALQRSGISISPYRIRLALENTAKPPTTGDCMPFSVGYGLVQIDAAFELLKKADSVPASLATIDVGVRETNNNLKDTYARGIYMREKHQTEKAMDFVVDFERHVVLKSSVPYVQHPQYLELMNQTREFQLRVDPTGLQKGIPHYTEVCGYDSANPTLGPLFRVPITVIVPVEPSADSDFAFKQSVPLTPALPYRLFVHVPYEATYA
ncbi:Subtilase family protein, partial [Aphelenchoides avenae]